MKKVMDWLNDLRAESPELARRQAAIQQRIAKLRDARKGSRNESEKTPVSPAKNNGLEKGV